MTDLGAGSSQWEMERIYAERIAFEHELISHRMSWLMTSNGFLVAGTALLLSNGDELTSPAALQALLLGIGTMGVVSNGSSFFSNYWASRGGIRGVGKALDDHWGTLSLAERERRRNVMRFFGRDPRALGLPPASPPSGILHPWFALPLTFAAVFAALPVFAPEFLRPGTALPDVFRFLHLLPVVAGVVLVLSDRRFHRRRNAARREVVRREVVREWQAWDAERTARRTAQETVPQVVAANGLLSPAAGDRAAGVPRPE